MSLVAAAFSRQVQWWVLRCESSQCLGVYEWWRAWACLRSEYGGERCKVNNGSIDMGLCHEEWVGQEKEWNCREGCSSLGPRLNWQVKAFSSWWGCCFFSDSPQGGLADNCQRFSVRGDNCQRWQLSEGTTVRGDNCQRTNCQRKLSELFWHWDNCKILQFQSWQL